MKTARKILLVLALTLGIPILATVTGLALLLMDDAPPEDADLQVRRLEIPDEENAFTYFQRAIEKLDLPSHEQADQGVEAATEQGHADSLSEAERWDRIVDGEAWDNILVKEVLKRNEAALALWEQGIACPHVQVPEVTGLLDKIPYVEGFFEMARLLGVRALAHGKRGDFQEAFDDTMRLVRFGHRLESAKGSLVPYLVGAGTKSIGLKRMRNLLGESTLSANRLCRYAADLAAYPADMQGLTDAFRVEYVVQVNTVEDLRSGKFGLSGLRRTGSVQQDRPSATKRLLWRMAQKPVFKPNRTKRLFADTCRQMVRNAPKHFKEVPRFELPFSQSDWLGHVLSRNPVGRMVYCMLVPALENMLKLKCHQNAGHAATRILLAMKAHQQEKGKLPQTLTGLVPHYLDAVPLDDFDGKPMRYDPQKKVIYSIGEDLSDDGGTTREEFIAARQREYQERGWEWTDEDRRLTEEEYNPWDTPDPSFPIDF
jgi:hypothetical protein